MQENRSIFKRDQKNIRIKIEEYSAHYKDSGATLADKAYSRRNTRTTYTKICEYSIIFTQKMKTNSGNVF